MINKKLNSFLLVVSALLFLLSISACSTKKNTWSRRAYHNVVCHYNVYWNGGMSMKEGQKQLQNDVEDNYNEVLRVYNYGLKKDAAKLNPKMDRTIKKASIGIQKNSMYFGGREYIKWVRKSYLMMGQAHFYKQDYTSARRVFDYVSKEYEDYPIRFEGYLWLAKTYIQTQRFQKAEATLNFLQSRIEESDFPASVKKEMVLVYADFYIAQNNYYAAYPYLERALEMGNKRDLVTRTQFILAQINQEEGDLQAASEYYKKVINRNPNYKMDFQARINLAKSYDEGTGDSKHINKVLKKMVKDYRNKEFLDQIYYALAEIAFKDDNK
ncbi:MAG TPA: tetratricopeptide repeat protein, partial [Bacteroidales bacterium]